MDERAAEQRLQALAVATIAGFAFRQCEPREGAEHLGGALRREDRVGGVEARRIEAGSSARRAAT